MKHPKIDGYDEENMKTIAQQGLREALSRLATLVTPALVSIMLGCLIAFFRWSVAQHHTAELVAREHSKAIEAIVEWQRQWKGYPTDSNDLVARAERAADLKISKLQGETQASLAALAGQIGSIQVSIGELKGFVQHRNGVAKAVD